MLGLAPSEWYGMDAGERLSYARGYRDHMDELWRMVGHVCSVVALAPHADTKSITSIYRSYTKVAYPDQKMEWEKTPSEKMAELLNDDNPPQ